MLIDRLWKTIRPFVPVQIYPLLAPVYLWRRRIHLEQLTAEDQRYLALHPDLKVPPAEVLPAVLAEPSPCGTSIVGEPSVGSNRGRLKSSDEPREYCRFDPQSPGGGKARSRASIRGAELLRGRRAPAARACRVHIPQLPRTGRHDA